MRETDHIGWLGSAVPLPDATDPLSLATAWRPDSYPLNLYWERPQAGEAFAGFGTTATLVSAREDEVAATLSGASAAPLRWISESPDVPGPWFGGLAFDPVRGGWQGFPAARWTLPSRAVARAKEKVWALAFCRSDRPDAEAHLASELEAVRAAASLPSKAIASSPLFAGELRQSPPARSDWNRLLESALTAIEAGTLSKVVTAREVELVADGEIRLPALLDALRVRHPRCTTFLFRGAGDALFVGATPETLLRVEGGRLTTEALAGTVAGEVMPAEMGEKELREHQAVIDAICSALSPLCEDLQLEPTSWVPLRGLFHLRTPISARLTSRPDALAEAVRALHPTPAVGGTPREAALEFLRRHESFARGWYAGAIGWFGGDRAHLCVALRSALIEGTRIRAFAGAGIVAGSDPSAEWDETALKLTAVLDPLRGGANARG